MLNPSYEFKMFSEADLIDIKHATFECIYKAERLFNICFGEVGVGFNPKISYAGATAFNPDLVVTWDDYSQRWVKDKMKYQIPYEIQFNKGLILADFKGIFEYVIPHEVAHLATWEILVHDEVLAREANIYRDNHGSVWQEADMKLGGNGKQYMSVSRETFEAACIAVKGF